MSTPGSAVRPAMQQQTTTDRRVPSTLCGLSADKEKPHPSPEEVLRVNTVLGFLSRATYKAPGPAPRPRVITCGERAAPYRTCPGTATCATTPLHQSPLTRAPHPDPRHLMTAKSMRSTRNRSALRVHLSRVHRASQCSLRVIKRCVHVSRFQALSAQCLGSTSLRHSRASHASAIPHQCTPLVGAHLTLAAEFSGRVSGRTEAACAERGTRPNQNPRRRRMCVPPGCQRAPRPAS